MAALCSQRADTILGSACAPRLCISWYFWPIGASPWPRPLPPASYSTSQVWSVSSRFSIVARENFLEWVFEATNCFLSLMSFTCFSSDEKQELLTPDETLEISHWTWYGGHVAFVRDNPSPLCVCETSSTAEKLLPTRKKCFSVRNGQIRKIVRFFHTSRQQHGLEFVGVH